MRYFYYYGDIAIENGGTYYALDTWKDGYADVLRVTACGDAGGPDNEWWIEQLTVSFDPKRYTKDPDIDSCLKVIGSDLAQISGMRSKPRRRLVIEACVAYGKYDVIQQRAVRIGKEQAGGREWGGNPGIEQLRGNTSLKRVVRDMLRDL